MTPDIQIEDLKAATRRCADCRLNRHGCARDQAHATGLGCKGFEDVTGIVFDEVQNSPDGVRYKLALRLDRESIEILVKKERKTGCAIWDAAILELSEKASMSPQLARYFGRILSRASEVAEILDRKLR